MSYLQSIGLYFLMIKDMFRKPTKWSVKRQLILKDIDDLVIDSIGIVAFISFFVGGVITIQTALNLSNPFIPLQLIGFATRQSILLEFAPTFISIIMAGKVGSFITSSIGTMRVTEQIDALEVMGVNSLNYLVFPKFVALMLYPFVIAIAMFLGVLGRTYSKHLWRLRANGCLYLWCTTRFYSVSYCVCVSKNINFCFPSCNYSIIPWVLYERWSTRSW